MSWKGALIPLERLWLDSANHRTPQALAVEVGQRSRSTRREKSNRILSAVIVIGPDQAVNLARVKPIYFLLYRGKKGTFYD
jgi:hypothetical protein